MSGREAEQNVVLCAMVKILRVFKSSGPKLAKGFEYIGVCDSCTGKCWRFVFIGLAAAISEFKCLIKIQLKSRVLKIFDWVKTGLVCLDLRKVNSTAFLSFA